MQNSDVLTQAIRITDLPALLAQHYPDSQAIAGKGGRVRRAWACNSPDKNASLKKYPDGTWYLHDFVTGQSWNAFGFLVEIGGLSKGQAAKKLISQAGLERDHTAKHRSRRQPRLEIKSIPNMPENLRDWVRVWRRLGGIRLGLEGAKRETLTALSDWIFDALRLYKAHLDQTATGATFEHCIDAFMGRPPRVCACGRHWTETIEIWDRNDNELEFSRLVYGCKQCEEFWTPDELETARAAHQKMTCTAMFRAGAIDLLAKHRRKLAKIRESR